MSCTLGLGAFALSLALVVRRTSDVMPASLTVSAWCDAALASVRAAGPSVCTLAVLAVATGIVACVRREPGQRLALFGAVCGVVALSIPLVVGLLALLIVGALVVAVLGA